MGLLRKLFQPIKNNIHGKVGEREVNRIIGTTNPANEYFVIKDYRFYDGEKSVQIDHIVLTNRYFICIESKNYSGMIFGNSKDLKWTQTLNYGKVKNKFYNPILQNNNHIKSLNKILNHNYDIINIVYFTKNADISNIRKMDEIYNKKKLKDKIKSMKINSENIINARQIYIRLIKNKSEITNKEHKKNIMKYKIDK